MYRDEDYRAIESILGFFPGCTIRPPLRMDTSCTPGGTGRVSPVGREVVYGDLLPSPSAQDPEQAALRRDLCETIGRLLAVLSDREREVIRLRFGFAGDPQTLEQIGAMFGLTRERIRQIEAKALKRLRGRQLLRFLEPWRYDDPGRPVQERWPRAAPPTGGARRPAVAREGSPADYARKSHGRAEPAVAGSASSAVPPARPPAPADDLPATAEDTLVEAISRRFSGGPGSSRTPAPAAPAADPPGAAGPPGGNGPDAPRERLLAMLEPPERAALERLYGFRPVTSAAAIEGHPAVPPERVSDLDRWFIRELRRLRTAPPGSEPAQPPAASAPQAQPVADDRPGRGARGLPADGRPDPLTAAIQSFRARGYEVVDNRPGGGSLWVHDLRMTLALEMDQLRQKGLRFRFAEHRRSRTWGWYFESGDTAASVGARRPLAPPSGGRTLRNARRNRILS